MSGQTKQDIRKDRDNLLENLNTVTDENDSLKMENEELAEKFNEIQTKLTICEDKLETTRNQLKALTKGATADLNALAHVTRQRDTLIGYIEGTREDRERANMIVPDHRDEPIERTRTDDFLDSMRTDAAAGAPGIGRDWEYP